MRHLPLYFLFAVSVATSTCVRRERSHVSGLPQSIETALPTSESPAQSRRININTASANELETLPGIGPDLAARIVEHREKYGAFCRPEHLMIIRGISEKRFEKLREFVTVE